MKCQTFLVPKSVGHFLGHPVPVVLVSCGVNLEIFYTTNVADQTYYIWTHKKFEMGYNGNQIVDVNLTSENRAKIQQGEKIPFTYEVVWKKSNINYEVGSALPSAKVFSGPLSFCPVNQSPGPDLEAKVIPACHNCNKQTNKQTGIHPSMSGWHGKNLARS